MHDETVMVPRRLIEELAHCLTASPYERAESGELPAKPAGLLPLQPGRIEALVDAARRQNYGAGETRAAGIPQPGRIEALVDAARRQTYEVGDMSQAGAEHISSTEAGGGGEFHFCRPKSR